MQEIITPLGDTPWYAKVDSTLAGLLNTTKSVNEVAKVVNNFGASDYELKRQEDELKLKNEAERLNYQKQLDALTGINTATGVPTSYLYIGGALLIAFLIFNKG